MLLIDLVAVVAAAVGAAVFDAAGASSTPARSTALSLGVSGGTLSLAHEGDVSFDVGSLVVHISVDDELLIHQPPVPFSSTGGFQPGPTDPFNAAADPWWTVGEAAILKLAGTNDPTIESGATVAIHIFDGDTPATVLEVTAS